MIVYSNKLKYGMQSLLYMKRFKRNHVFSAAYISEQLQIPKEFISKILQTLALKGILISKKGKGGGFSFAVDPQQIKLKTIFDSLGHTKKFEKCLFGRDVDSCSQEECMVCSLWTTFNKEMTYIINNHTLGNLCLRLETDFNN